METCKRRQLERRWRNFGFEVDKQQNDDQCSRKLLVLKSTKMSYNASLINNKNRRKAIFNWAAKGLFFLRGGGGYTHSGYHKTLSATIACDRTSCETET